MKREIDRREFLKQTSLAGVAVGTGVPLAPALGRAAGSTPPVEAAPPPADRQLDSRDFCLSLYESRRPALTFAARDAAGARRWQRTTRDRIAELVGGFPERPVDLRAEVVERRDMGGYVREKVFFQTRENLSALGYLLLPKERSGPVPVVVCLPGHGRGADDIVGIAEDGTQRAEKAGYARDFAIQVVERGHAAFALELLAFGARRDAPARAKGPAAYSCQPAASTALLFGQTMVGWRVWDTMRSIDYLSTRPEIDATRVATMGISGGGTISLFAAALDPRVKAAVVSGYFNTFRDSIVSLSHCVDNYVPGILNHVEMYDLAGLVAPRALFVEAGRRDPIFPLPGVQLALERARTIYDVFGAPDRLGAEIFEGGHEFHGVGAFRFLAERL